MSKIRFSGGAVADLAPGSVPPVQSQAVPVHCGMPMEWKSPESATLSVYSFAPADAPAELPPLWRCGCGFQLDGIIRTSSLQSELSR